jgi:hypothetical protein
MQASSDEEVLEHAMSRMPASSYRRFFTRSSLKPPFRPAYTGLAFNGEMLE